MEISSSSVIREYDVPNPSSGFSPFQWPRPPLMFFPKREDHRRRHGTEKRKDETEEKDCFQTNDTDAILKKNRIKRLSISKRERRSAEADDFIRIATLDVFRRKDTQHTQQDKKHRCGRIRYAKRRREERGKKEDGLRFGLGVLMFSFERVGVRNNHTIHHMRVGEQRDASQIGYEQQREEPFHYIP